jgi:hypothetical protein
MLAAAAAVVAAPPQLAELPLCPVVSRLLVGDWIAEFLSRHPEGRVVDLRRGVAGLRAGARYLFLAGDSLELLDSAAAARFFGDLGAAFPKSLVAFSASPRLLSQWQLADVHRFPCVFSDVWLIATATVGDAARRVGRWRAMREWLLARNLRLNLVQLG